MTLVVPVRGQAATLEPLLCSLEAQVDAEGIPFDVVVVDDASERPLAPSLERRADRGLSLRVVRRDENGGPGAARNSGLAVVDTPWVAFLDADVVPASDWLQRLTGLVEPLDAPDVIEGRTSIGGDQPATPFAHATEIVPPQQRGAGNLICRTEVLRSVGGFDERFYDVGRRVHFREDADLLFRLEDAGCRFGFAPELIVVHPPLEPSFWTPVKLARRYYFDPLLGREHPVAFAELNESRRVGPMSLRRARHDAALLLVGGSVAATAGVVTRRAAVTRAGVAAILVGWVANVLALAWRKEVRLRDAVPLAAVSLLVPWAYLSSYWRGVVHFRHRPRL